MGKQTKGIKIGEALRLLRVFHDFKAKEFAKIIEISPSYFSEIESGKKQPSLDIIGRYAKVFNTKPSAILFFSENADETPCILPRLY